MDAVPHPIFAGALGPAVAQAKAPAAQIRRAPVRGRCLSVAWPPATRGNARAIARTG